MGSQTLCIGQKGSRPTQVPTLSCLQGNHAGPLDEIDHAQWAGETSSAFRRHDVTGASNVVSQYLEAALTDKDTAGILNPAHQRPGICGQQTQMLRRIRIGQLYSLFQIRGNDDAPASSQRSSRDIGPAQGLQLASHLCLNLAGQAPR